MAYTETCMENLLPAGVFLRTAVLELGRQLILVTSPADGILVAVSSSRSAGRRMLPPNTLHLHEPPTELPGSEAEDKTESLEYGLPSCPQILVSLRTSNAFCTLSENPVLCLVRQS